MKMIIDLNPDEADFPIAIKKINRLQKLNAVEFIEQKEIIVLREHTGEKPICPKVKSNDNRKKRKGKK